LRQTSRAQGRKAFEKRFFCAFIQASQEPYGNAKGVFDSRLPRCKPAREGCVGLRAQSIPFFQEQVRIGGEKGDGCGHSHSTALFAEALGFEGGDCRQGAEGR